MIVLALLFLLATEPSQPTGELTVNVADGTEVYVDGELAGVAAVGGQTVRGLAVGPHKVMLRATNGGIAEFNVNIIEGKGQSISVSPLGFRMKPKSTAPVAAVRIQSDETPCTVRIGDVETEKTQHELNINTVPSGRQRLTIICGNQRIDSMLTLADGEMQIIEPDFARRVATVVGHRRRVTALTVTGGQDEIVNANIPVDWKRALASAAGECRAVAVTPVSYSTVIITYRCPTEQAAMRVIDRLRASDIISSVDTSGVQRRGSDGILVTLRVKFRVAGAPPR